MYEGTRRRRASSLLVAAVVLPLFGATVSAAGGCGDCGSAQDVIGSAMEAGRQRARENAAENMSPADGGISGRFSPPGEAVGPSASDLAPLLKGFQDNDALRSVKDRPFEGSAETDNDQIIERLRPLMKGAEAIRRAAAEAANMPLSTGRLTIPGEGAAKASPDVATFRFGVVIADDDVANATTKAESEARAIREGLLKAGVVADEITIDPVAVETVVAPMALSSGAGRSRYGVRAGMVVEVRRLGDRDESFLRNVMSSANAAGAKEIAGPEFRIDDPKVLSAARTAAVDDATVKAATYAHALGARVGRVVEVREEAQGIRPIRMPMPSIVGSRVPREVRAGVTVVWELEQVAP